MTDRKSEAEIPALIEDPMELAKREAANALDQFDWAMDEVGRWIVANKPSLKISMLLSLHRKAMDGIDPYAGNFRPAAVAIKGSSHQPISGDDVPRNIEEMLEYLSENWADKTAIHLCSYAMWRLNWIHPFADGNGRTSRMISYMVLCGSLRQVLPGTRTIPEQISEDKGPYYKALEAADEGYKRGQVDVSKMEKLLEEYLAVQLIEIHDQANGRAKTASTYHPVEAAPKQNSFVASIENKPVIVGAAVAILLAAIVLFFG
jgi:Fic family protein